VLVLLYNATLLVVDALALRALARDARPARFLRVALATLATMVLLALLGMAFASDERYEGSLFTFLGLLAWSLFGHGIPLLFLAARALWREQRALAWSTLALALALAAAGLEGFVRGPRALEVTRYEIASEKLHAPLRAVLLADLQTDRVGERERRALRAALAEEPDLLLFAGDYVQADEERWGALVGELNGLLRAERLSARVGLFAVEGNVDRPGWPAAFDGLGVRCFVATGAAEAGEVLVTGLSFEDSFDAGLSVPPSERFHLVLGHAPDFALGDVRADLLVAGHTHGGQVRIPGFGPLLTLSRVPRAWASGRTELPGGRTLVVSRGLGMERGLAPRVRFLCPPEIVVLDLVPAR
jgi:predicted MPP superfamily phosphohydrolase